MSDIRFGTERETTTLDEMGSTVTVIRKLRDYEVAKTYKQFRVRVKVRDPKEETVEFMKHSDLLRDKRAKGVLVIKDEDPTVLPSFVTEYPKFNEDNTYFVISSWSEIVE